MIHALEHAAEDAHAPSLLARADSIRVPKGLWDYSNPAKLLAEHFGANSPETMLAPMSGNMVQFMISDAAREIANARREVVLVCGGECQHSMRRARAAGTELAQTVQTDSWPDVAIDHDGELVTPHEIRLGLGRPTLMYALFETAMRHARGESHADHLERLSQLWAGFSAVAAENPNAWIRDAKSAEEIRTPSPHNRMIASPYTKLMTANMVVDQAAAVIVCSEQAAIRAGVPRDRFVYLHAATDGPIARPVSKLDTLDDQPAMKINGMRALELADVDIGAIDHIDLYSCFPSAVQMGARALGIDENRSLTVTGGLTFGGGPFNSYVLHAIAQICDRLRAAPGSLGLVTSLGGYLAKHAHAIYSTAPPPAGFQHADTGAELAQLPTREVIEDYIGPARVESYTVGYGSKSAHTDGPMKLFAACRTPDARRVWGTATDPDLLAAAEIEELCGRDARIGSGNILELH
jgi:acetyl-CoA C-acetyltransferase